MKSTFKYIDGGAAFGGFISSSVAQTEKMHVSIDSAVTGSLGSNESVQNNITITTEAETKLIQTKSEFNKMNVVFDNAEAGTIEFGCYK